MAEEDGRSSGLALSLLSSRHLPRMHEAFSNRRASIMYICSYLCLWLRRQSYWIPCYGSTNTVHLQQTPSLFTNTLSEYKNSSWLRHGDGIASSQSLSIWKCRWERGVLGVIFPRCAVARHLRLMFPMQVKIRSSRKGGMQPPHLPTKRECVT